MKEIIKKIIVWLTLLSFIIEATPVWAIKKDETIYAKVDNNGSIYSNVIYETLFNDGQKIINDKSSLNNITNVNGEEKYTKDENNLIWEANGETIYYSGNTDNELPISMTIKYYLNGQEKDVKDILGKNGQIKIEINYENKLKHQILVNNKIETLYTPFVIATSSLLSNANNNNIKISSGKVIDNGNTSLIIGVSSPGLHASLGLKELAKLDKLVISYETKSFELSSIYAVATPKLIGENDLDILNNVKNLYKGISALQENMDLLVDGSQQLANGTQEFNEAISSLSNKYFEYRNLNKDEIITKISPVMEKSLEKIVPILQEKIITESIGVIEENKDELVKTLVDATITNTKEVINGEIKKIISNIDFGKYLEEIIGSHLMEALLNDESIQELSSTFTDELESLIRDEINQVTKQAINDINSNYITGMNEENKQDDIEYLTENFGLSEADAIKVFNKIQNDTIDSIRDNITNNKNNISNNISNTVINNINSSDYMKHLMTTYVKNVSIRIATIIRNNPQLNDYQIELIANISNYIKNELSKESLIKKYIYASNYINEVTDTIIEKTISDIANQYTGKMTTKIVKNLIEKEFKNPNINDELYRIIAKYETDINTKLKEVDKKINLLTSSVALINDGTNQLADGLNRYNNEGIKKISSLVNGDVKSLSGKIEALINLSKKYKTFDDINNNMEGSSKIIFMIDAIKTIEEKKITSDKIVESESLWDKIKGLFK